MPRLKIVPFNPAWITARGQSGVPLLDIHAIYRRPRIDHHYASSTSPGDETAEATVIRDDHGFIEWDLTTGLPVQHHQRWTARHFVYVTLSDRRSLEAVGKPELAEQGVAPLDDWRSYIQNQRELSAWAPSLYLLDLQVERNEMWVTLERDIADLGWERAEVMTQQRYQDPDYRVPAALRVAVPAKAAEPDPTVPAAEGLSLSEKQALSRARRKVAQGKTLTDLEQAVLDSVDGVAA